MLVAVTGWSEERLKLLGEFKPGAALATAFKDTPECTDPSTLCSLAIGLENNKGLHK